MRAKEPCTACLSRSTHKPKWPLLALLLCACTLVWSDLALALSIGKPQFDAGLAQTLRVRIPVRGFSPGTHAQDYTVSALADSDYAKLGLAIPPFPLHQLEFRWLKETPSGAEILITSERVMTEPVVNILLEVRGFGRRWVKQIDLLLDPSITRSLSTAPKPTTHLGNALHADQYGPVQAGEVLSVIAQKVRPHPQIPLVQMAQAIIDANPKAFPAGPQSLRAGTLLQVPKLREIERAALNKQIMQPAPRGTRKHHVAATQATTPFLPQYRYANGAMYPLSMLFLSYDAIKPVDLKPHLVALERAEPVRFKADWTLNQAPATAVRNRLANPLDPIAPEDIQQAQPAQLLVQDELSSELGAPQENIGIETATKGAAANTASNSPLSTAQQKPRIPTERPVTDVVRPTSPNTPEQPRWWLWLLGLVIALMFWKWLQNRSANQQALAPRIPYNKQSSDAPPLHLASKAVVAKQSTNASSPDTPPSADADPATSQPESGNAANEEAASEQEEQQLRRDIRAMLNAKLPSEAERKLKIAEALAERGNYSRAKQMVTEVQDTLSKL